LKVRATSFINLIFLLFRLNDPEQICKHTQLSLPAPQLSDRELEEISKMGYRNPEELLEDDDQEKNKATRTLLSSYNTTPTPQVLNSLLRTPTRTPARGDTVLMEAQNLVALTQAKTPLVGGENTPLHPSDFSGATPASREVHTPNPLSTPGRNSIMNTPKGATGNKNLAPSTPLRTPVRDQLHINEETALVVVQSEKAKELELKKQLKKRIFEITSSKKRI